MKSVQLNEGLEELGKFVFYRSAIESIKLPSTLKRIETRAFFDCRSLRSVEISEGVV